MHPTPRPSPEGRITSAPARNMKMEFISITDAGPGASRKCDVCARVGDSEIPRRRRLQNPYTPGRLGEIRGRRSGIRIRLIAHSNIHRETSPRNLEIST